MYTLLWPIEDGGSSHQHNQDFHFASVSTMVSLQQLESSSSKIRLIIATFLCLFFLLALIEAWKRDIVSVKLQPGLLSIGHTDTDYGSFAFEDEPSPDALMFPRPAIVAGAVTAESLSWMQNMTEL